MKREFFYHIKDVNFVDVFKERIYRTDVFIENGVFAKGKRSRKHYEVINGNKLYLLPTFFDLHAHSRGLKEKNKNTLQELQNSALRGGYSDLLIMPNTNPPIDCVENLQKLKQEAKDLFINIYYSGCLTKGREGKECACYSSLKKEGVLAFSDDGRSVQSTHLMYEICKTLSKMKALIIEHPELEELTANTYMTESHISRKYKIPSSPAYNENIIVYRDLLIAKNTKAKIHLTHISTGESIRIIEEFNKYYNLNISFDVTPHHLLVSVDNIDKFDGTYNVKPFLRERSECEKLQEALIRNRISIIATDHAPHTVEEKLQPLKIAPYGFIGLEFAFGLLFTHFVKTGKMGLVDLVKKFSVNPAKVLHIDLKKKMYQEGNFALWDLGKMYKLTPKKISSRAKNTPFLNYNIYGEPKYIFMRGAVKYSNP